MNYLVIIIIGLILVSVAFATINSMISDIESKKFIHFLISGSSTVVVNVAVGLIILVVPTSILVNYLKPQPENTMPAFYYDGTYTGITDKMTVDVAELLADECTQSIIQQENLTAYYDRAYLYFYTHNYDLARKDLERCFEDTGEWKYIYDLGVVCGYMLDYKSSIQYFEYALDLDIPLSDRGVVEDSLSLIESYFDSWVFSLFG